MIARVGEKRRRRPSPSPSLLAHAAAPAGEEGEFGVECALCTFRNVPRRASATTAAVCEVCESPLPAASPSPPRTHTTSATRPHLPGGGDSAEDKREEERLEKHTRARREALSPAPSSLPPVLLPASLLSLPLVLPWPSPLAPPLLSSVRFRTAQLKGELALAELSVHVDPGVELHMRSAVVAACDGVGVAWRCVAHEEEGGAAYSVELHRLHLDYSSYQRRHAAFAQRKADSSVSSVASAFPPVGALLPRLFLLYPARLFCRDWADGRLQSNVRRAQQRLQREVEGQGGERAQVQVRVWGLRALLAELRERPDGTEERGVPFPHWPAVLSAVSGVWLQSRGQVQVQVEHEDVQDACVSLLWAIRHSAQAKAKADEDEERFRFGSLRAIKGRTSAMKGAHPDIHRRRRKREGGDHNARGEGGEQDGEEEAEAGGALGLDEQDGSAEDEAGAELCASTRSAARLRGCEESWVHMLALIRGVSEEKAAVISRHFPSLRALVEAYRTQPSTQKAEQLLSELQCGQRKMGEQLSKRVYHTLARGHSPLMSAAVAACTSAF